MINMPMSLVFFHSYREVGGTLAEEMLSCLLIYGDGDGHNWEREGARYLMRMLSGGRVNFALHF